MSIWDNLDTTPEGASRARNGFDAMRENQEGDENFCSPGRTGNPVDPNDKCRMWPYHISHMQLGEGASSLKATYEDATLASGITSLGQPLTRAQYGGPSKSIMLEDEDHWIYSNEGVKIAAQTVGVIGNQGALVSGLVSVIVVDESTANGTVLDEVGLLVNNPYLVEEQIPGGGDSPLGRIGPTTSLLGGGHTGTGEFHAPKPQYEPGNLLAAYRQFPAIKKEEYFTLLIRWKINFTENCA